MSLFLAPYSTINILIIKLLIRSIYLIYDNIFVRKVVILINSKHQNDFTSHNTMLSVISTYIVCHVLKITFFLLKFELIYKSASYILYINHFPIILIIEGR